MIYIFRYENESGDKYRELFEDAPDPRTAREELKSVYGPEIENQLKAEGYCRCSVYSPSKRLEDAFCI